MQQYAQRNIRNYLHYYTFPKWSAGNKYVITCLAAVTMATGIAGAGMSHQNIPDAIHVWHVSIFSVAACLSYCFRGLYQVYMDYGWDVYY